jgi:ubiquinone/menaquinone biosynthesis C-methylase UbiE
MFKRLLLEWQKSSMKEPILEPLLRKLRIKKVVPVLKKFPECKLLDIGCGWEAKFLRQIEPYIINGIGIDFKAPNIKTDKIKTISATLNDTLPFPDNIFNVVTLMAALEHLENPEAILCEIHRVLQNGGVIVGTVPSKASKHVLEFLSYKLNVVNPAEIRNHKRYIKKKSLKDILTNAGFINIKHRYFQLGMNNFFLANCAKYKGV